MATRLPKHPRTYNIVLQQNFFWVPLFSSEKGYNRNNYNRNPQPLQLQFFSWGFSMPLICSRFCPFRCHVWWNSWNSLIRWVLPKPMLLKQPKTSNVCETLVDLREVGLFVLCFLQKTKNGDGWKIIISFWYEIRLLIFFSIVMLDFRGCSFLSRAEDFCCFCFGCGSLSFTDR